ncbi:enoyl-CoA hydratase-related protein [Chloroflexota bacterium]
MGDYQTVKASVEGRTAILTIDNPPANAFNRQQLQDLGDAFDEATGNEEVKVIIITAAGQFFIAGADIKEMAAIRSKEESYEMLRAGQLLFDRIERSTKPVIAAINGRFCLGGGNELAMACHIRIAEDSVQFGQPEIKWAMIPGWGGTQRLPRLVGKGRALEIILGGGNIKAQEAFRIGLVNKVVPVGSVVREAKRWAKVLSMWSSLSMAAILESVNEGLEMSREDGLKNEARLFSELTETDDMREGITAFIEKRRPKFQDK